MGSTILQTTPKRVNGLLLFESFESINFVPDQGWTLVNGSPQISSNTAKQGLKSFIMDLSYPLIEKNFTAAGTSFRWSAGYFFDDATIVAGGYSPFMQWRDGAGNTYGLGVNHATSAGFYTKEVLGVLTATAIPRVSGWHRFDFEDSTVTGRTMRIDNVSVSVTGFAGGPYTKVRVGSRTAAGAPAFGYFDWIQACVDKFVNVENLTAGQVLRVYDSTNTLIGSATAAAGLASVNVQAKDAPFDGYMVITKKDGIAPFFRSPLMQLSPGDLYFLNVYDFGRRAGTIDIKDSPMRNDIESTDGENQSVFFHARDRVVWTFSDLTEDQKNDLERWWTTAKRGVIFGAALDSDAVYSGRTITSASGFPAGLIVTDSNVGLNKGSRIVIESQNGRIKETATVASLTGANVVNLTAPQAEADQDAMLVRSLYYYPFAITTDKQLSISLSNLKKKRWNASIAFKQAIQP